MIRATAIAATIGCLALAGCGNSEPAPAPSPTPTIAAPRTLVGADLDLATLGAKIVGPQGPEVETVLSAGNRQIGTLVSYVACPAGTLVCEPGEMPADTVYTYVHAITLVDAEDAAEDPVADAPDLRETPPTLFRTLRAATVGADRRCDERPSRAPARRIRSHVRAVCPDAASAGDAIIRGAPRRVAVLADTGPCAADSEHGCCSAAVGAAPGADAGCSGCVAAAGRGNGGGREDGG